MFSVDKYRQGFASWVALTVVFCTSLERLRRRKYQLFYTLHFAFLFFYLFAATHTPKFHFYGYLAMAIYGFDKLQRIARGCASYAERRPRAQAPTPGLAGGRLACNSHTSGPRVGTGHARSSGSRRWPVGRSCGSRSPSRAGRRRSSASTSF